MNILCAILFYVCSSHAQTPLNDISGTNTIYSASEVDYRIESRVPTNRTITIGSQVGSLQTNLVFTSTGEGVTEPTVTNIAQAVASAYLPLSGGTMTGDISMGSNILNGFKFGREAGQSSSGYGYFACGVSAGENAIGDGWLAIGNSAGIGASGDEWVSIGSNTGDGSSGNFWLSVGRNSGQLAIGNSWASFGNYSAYNARGDGCLYVDSYISNPYYSEGGATNDMIFGDNGYLYLGRGLGAPGGQQGGTLRGAWAFNDSLTLFGKTITWNASRQTFNFPLYGGVVGQLFQEQLMLVRNQTGANIGNGKIVCSAGAVGDNSAIRKASNTDASCAWGVLGMVTQDAGIDHGSDGLICTGGEVNNVPLPTSIYQPSNTLWLATDGNYTNVEPQNVAVKYQIGIVLRAHATEGRIQFHPQFIPSPASIGAASASNATLTGTATINGDVIIGAGGVTNAILANQQLIANLETIIKDVVTSTNVLRVVSTQSVYVATVTSPCVITQDVSALTLATNQTAFWTTRINVTDWSATNGITFATNIAAYAGGFTVTGCYDFACSLLCDGRIEMRQTFPTVTDWFPVGVSGAGNNVAPNAAVINPSPTIYFLPSGLTGGVYLAISSLKSPSIIRFAIRKVSSIGFPTNVVSVTAGLNNRTYDQPTVILASPITVSTTDMVMIALPSFEMDVNYIVNLFMTRPYNIGSPIMSSVDMRTMNQLEIRAYNSGWRPQ